MYRCEPTELVGTSMPKKLSPSLVRYLYLQPNDKLSYQTTVMKQYKQECTQVDLSSVQNAARNRSSHDWHLCGSLPRYQAYTCSEKWRHKQLIDTYQRHNQRRCWGMYGREIRLFCLSETLVELRELGQWPIQSCPQGHRDIIPARWTCTWCCHS